MSKQSKSREPSSLKWTNFRDAISEQKGVIAARVISTQYRQTRTGNKIAILLFSDGDSTFEALAFSEVLRESDHLLVPGTEVLLTLKAENRPEGVGVRIAGIEAAENAVSGLEQFSHIPSPVTFAVNPQLRIVAKPSEEVSALVKDQIDRQDYTSRLLLCRASASGLIETINSNRFNVRAEYAEILQAYSSFLPEAATAETASEFLLADQEARILRELFASEVAILSPVVAARLKAFLQAHQALRVFFPALTRFYDDVRFGRNDAPLPLDSFDAILAVAKSEPEVFDRSVEEALTMVSSLPPQLSEARPMEPAEITPPRDVFDDITSEKSEAVMKASMVIRLLRVFEKGEHIQKQSDAWIKVATQLSAPAQTIFAWAARFL